MTTGSGFSPHLVTRFVADLDRQVRSLIDGQLVATILHGSAALGRFVPGRSDVDVLMLVDSPDLAAGVLQSIAERFHAVTDRCPGAGLEISVVAAGAAADPGPPWPYLLHVTTQADDPRTVFGRDGDGVPDLLMHDAVCRSAGIAVTGPLRSTAIGEIRRSEVLDYLRHELAWAGENADTTYGVLNACRAWQFVTTGELASKLDGASWAIRSGGPEAVITAAVSAQTDGGDGPPRLEADELMGAVDSIIEEAIAQLQR